MANASIFWSLILGISSLAAPNAQVATPADALEPLPRLHTTAVTVSGISSGAHMALQFSVVNSSLIEGAAMFAGGPYGCAEGSAIRAVSVCMNKPEIVSAPGLVELAKKRAGQGEIDPVSLLAKRRFYLFQGTLDPVVRPAAAVKTREFLSAFGVTMKERLDTPAGHGLPVLKGPVPCKESRLPWVNECGFDGIGEALAFLYDLPEKLPAATKAAGRWYRFSQTAFGSREASMADAGDLYIPAGCGDEARSCRLHVAFHGCLQSPAVVKRAFVDSGYQAWADAHSLVLLFPAVKAGVKNPNGCWDWWGYTGKGYATRSGAQIKVIREMIEALR